MTITQLAEDLDRTTLELAMRIVPVEWWAARLGTTVPVPPLQGEPGSTGEVVRK